MGVIFFIFLFVVILAIIFMIGVGVDGIIFDGMIMEYFQNKAKAWLEKRLYGKKDK